MSSAAQTREHKTAAATQDGAAALRLSRSEVLKIGYETNSAVILTPVLLRGDDYHDIVQGTLWVVRPARRYDCAEPPVAQCD